MHLHPRGVQLKSERIPVLCDPRPKLPVVRANYRDLPVLLHGLNWRRDFLEDMDRPERFHLQHLRVASYGWHTRNFAVRYNELNHDKCGRCPHLETREQDPPAFKPHPHVAGRLFHRTFGLHQFRAPGDLFVRLGWVPPA